MKQIVSFILDLLFPKRCFSCGSLGTYLCDNCVTQLNYNRTNICPVCERPSIDGATHPRCKTRYTMDGLLSFWPYEGIVRKIIHKIKYDPFISDAIKEIIEKVTSRSSQQKLGSNILSPSFMIFIKNNPILIPIPLHKSRLRWRGYNHAALIARALAQKWNLEVNETLLFRIKKTRPQVELKGKERQENIKNAFSINKSYHVSRIPSHVILIDDVWTTGSTLKTCATLLKRNGAKVVWGLTLAR